MAEVATSRLPDFNVMNYLFERRQYDRLDSRRAHGSLGGNSVVLLYERIWRLYACGDIKYGEGLEMKDGTYTNFPIMAEPPLSSEIARIIALTQSIHTLPQTILVPPSVMSELERSISERAKEAVITSFPLEIISSPYCIMREQIRFPRSKRKRIRKKWSKNESNWGDVPKIFLIDNNDFFKNPMEIRR